MSNKFFNNNRSWLPEHDDALLRLDANGMSKAEMSKILGRTEKAIRLRLQLLAIGVPNRKPTPVAPLPIEKAISEVNASLSRNNRSWLPDEDAKIIAYADAGHTFEQIGIAVGRSWRAVESRLSVLRVSEKARKAREAAEENTVHTVAADISDEIFTRDLTPEPVDIPEGTILHFVPSDTLINGKPFPAIQHKADPELELFLWFMEQAWVEGHEVIIPALGATFKRPAKEE